MQKLIVFLVLLIFTACKKVDPPIQNIPNITLRQDFKIPCYHLSPTKPVAYIQGSDTVIYTYDNAGRLILAAKFNSLVANQYSYSSNTLVLMNNLPLGGDTYLPAEYQFYFNSNGTISNFTTYEPNALFANFFYNHAGQLDSLGWQTPMVENHGQYGIFDSTVYDSYGNLIAFISTSTDVQTHYTFTTRDKQIMTYYPNQNYQEYDPERKFNGLANYYGLDPQIFSKNLIATQNSFNAPANYIHYFYYSLNNLGLISEVTDSSASSVVKRYIYYDCQ